jgi:hypothetical protein
MVKIFNRIPIAWMPLKEKSTFEVIKFLLGPLGERRGLNPRMVDSQSTALIHLATSAPIPAAFSLYLREDHL